MKLSIVVPCFNEEACLPALHERLAAAARGAVGEDYEIVLVNDGSRDSSWAIMQAITRTDSHVLAVNLSRNHGHQLALTAGLDLCRGDHDADHRRRPAGPARAVAANARDDAPRECRRGLWRAQEPVGRDCVQARHGARLLPLAVARDRGRHPASMRATSG